MHFMPTQAIRNEVRYRDMYPAWKGQASVGHKNEGLASGLKMWKFLAVRDPGKKGDSTDVQCCPQMGP